MTLSGMKAIRYFSWMNDFLNFTVIVPEKQADEAVELIKKALDMYWDDEYETYGDAVYGELNGAGIPFFMIGQPWNDKSDCPDTSVMDYEKWLDEFDEGDVITLHS